MYALWLGRRLAENEDGIFVFVTDEDGWQGILCYRENGENDWKDGPMMERETRTKMRDYSWDWMRTYEMMRLFNVIQDARFQRIGHFSNTHDHFSTLYSRRLYKYVERKDV